MKKRILHGYQEKARASVNRLRDGGICRRALLVMPTGGGKTCVAVSLIRSRDRVLFLAHRKELIEQAVARLIEWGFAECDIGIIRGGLPENPKAKIQIATLQTIVRPNRSYPKAELVIVDEAHRAVDVDGGMYKTVLSQYPNAFILGLTATPLRLDGKPLRPMFDEMVIGATYGELQAGKHIPTPRVFTQSAKKLPDLRGARRTGGDFNRDDRVRLERKVIKGDVVSHFIKRGQGSAVLFASSIERSIEYADTFCKRGIRAEHIDGETPEAEREAILDRLKSGHIQVVTNVDILTEGWDPPSHVRTAILCRLTASLVRYRQMVGRILRRGVTPVVLDHVGDFRIHGFPDFDPPWSLDVAAKSAGGGQAPCKVCEACHCVVPTGSLMCPECGSEFEIVRDPETEAGELEEALRLTPREREKQIAVFAKKFGRSITWATLAVDARAFL